MFEECNVNYIVNSYYEIPIIGLLLPVVNLLLHGILNTYYNYEIPIINLLYQLLIYYYIGYCTISELEFSIVQQRIFQYFANSTVKNN